MYQVSWSFGLWCLVVRATGNTYYSESLGDVLTLVEQPLC